MAIGEESPHHASTDRRMERLLHPLAIKGAEESYRLIERLLHGNPLLAPQIIVRPFLFSGCRTRKITLDLSDQAVPLVGVNVVPRKVSFTHINKTAQPHHLGVVENANARPAKHNQTIRCSEALQASAVAYVHCT